MTRLLCLLTLFVLPLMAVDVTITIGLNTETFTITSNQVTSAQAMRASRADEDDNCPALKDGEPPHDCSTGVKYVMWKLKQLINTASIRFPQGQDATDRASIAVLESGIEARKVN